MTWNTTASPAGWVTVTGGRYAKLFLDGDPLAFTLSGTAAISYEVRDYFGTVVAFGAASGTSLTVPTLPLGWYKLYLYQAGNDATYGHLIGAAHFSVVRAGLGLQNPPAPGTTPSTGTGGEYPDHIIRGLSLIGPMRNQIVNALDPNTGTFHSVPDTQADRAYQRAWYEANADTVRPRPAFCQFPNGGYQSSAYTDGVSACVAALYPDIKYFEGPINEPDINNAATATAMQTFKTAVKAGNSSAKVMGPSTLNYDAGSLRTFIANGGLVGVDALSFHPYNASNGSINHGRKSFDAIQDVLDSTGYGALEKWQTEWGAFAATYGVFKPRQQIRWGMIQRFLLDQHGIPKERDYWFYDSGHGFWDFPSFWRFDWFSDVTALVPIMRVYSQELFGKAWSVPLDFGTVDNNTYIGSKYVNPNDGTAVMTFLSEGRTEGSVRVRITGASSVQLVGPFGTVTTATADAQGLVTVPVAQEPCYLRLPAGADGTVEAVFYGTDLARSGTGVAGSDGIASVPIGGTYYQPFYDDTSTLPTHYEVDWATPVEFDTIIVRNPPPWQLRGAFLDFDISYKDTDNNWQILGTFTEPTLTFSAPSNQGPDWPATGCFLDSFWSGRSIFTVELDDPTIAQAIRLDIRSISHGGEATLEAVNVGGQGWTQLRTSIEAVQVFLRRQPLRRRSFPSRVAI